MSALLVHRSKLNIWYVGEGNPLLYSDQRHGGLTRRIPLLRITGTNPSLPPVHGSSLTVPDLPLLIHGSLVSRRFADDDEEHRHVILDSVQPRSSPEWQQQSLPFMVNP
jgi:hypothetical protein